MAGKLVLRVLKLNHVRAVIKEKKLQAINTITEKDFFSSLMKRKPKPL